MRLGTGNDLQTPQVRSVSTLVWHVKSVGSDHEYWPPLETAVPWNQPGLKWQHGPALAAEVQLCYMGELGCKSQAETHPLILQVQGVPRHWTPEDLAKSQALYEIRHLENIQVSSSCL